MRPARVNRQRSHLGDVSRRSTACLPPPRASLTDSEPRPSTHTMWLFAIASAALVAIPGPAVIYIVTRGVAHGRRGAFVSMLGVEVGNYVEVMAATVGLAAIIASSATAFTVVKLAGAAY